MALLGFALHWLLVCLLCALLWWAVAGLFARRRPQQPPARMGVLFVAFLLVALAGSCLLAETRGFAVRAPLVAMFVPVLFALFYYLFSDERFAPRWSRWLVMLYGLSQIGALIPPKPPDRQFDQFFGSVPVLLGALGLIGDCWAVTAVALALLPQVAARTRDMRAPAWPRPHPRRATAACGSLVLVPVVLVQIATGLFADSSTASLTPASLAGRTAFFLFAALAPAGVAFALAQGWRYDVAAVTNRVLVAVPLVLALASIYGAYALALLIFFPGFAGLPSPAYIPFVLLIALILAVVFRPLRARLQVSVDRWLFRRTFDAAQAFATFPATIGPNSHLEALGSQLVAAIQKALQPDAVALWLCALPERFAYRGGGLVAMPAPAAGQESTTAQPADRRPGGDERLHRQAVATRQGALPGAPPPDLALDGALLAVLRGSPMGLPLDRLRDWPAARALHASDAALAVPLVAGGELVGLVTLCVSERASPYTADERALLAALLESSAPALRAVQWEYEQEVRTRTRERVEQELRTARRIQEALLPKAVPALDGWQLAARYQPAREVGGDFYDFLPLPDGRLGIVLGDVTDKGMAAALVMATTRSMLRAVATRPAVSPGQALAHVNELLCPDLPASMFVTCFYGILDPATGHLHFANAGQDLPCRRHADGTVGELYATGMPLGLLPGMRYEEREATLAPGEYILFYSDGIVEAHNPTREMFGFPRLRTLLAGDDASRLPPIACVLGAVTDFTGADWEQEDDITLVALRRLERP